MELEELKVSITAEISQYKQQLNNATKEIEKFKKQMEKASQSSNGLVSGFGKAIKKIGLLFAGLQIGKFVKNSISEAMNVIESESLFETSFGQYADEVRKFTDELNKSLGTNAYAMRKNAGTMFTFAKNMGISGESAKDMSMNLSLLAEDMASFYNLSTDEAFTKLMAGVSGETEPLKRLGVSISDASMKAYLLKQGLDTNTSALSEQEKVLIRYNMIMASTSTAQGDLARTLESPANAVRRFQTSLQYLKVALGNAFLPIVQIVVPLLNTMVVAITRVVNVVASFMNALLGKSSAQVKADAQEWNEYKDVQTGVADSFGDTAGAIDNVGKSAKKTKGFLAGFDEINKISEKDSGGAGSSGGTSGGANIGGAGLEIDSLGSSISSTNGKVDEMVENFKRKIESMKRIISKNKVPIISTFAGIMAGIIGYIAKFKGAEIVGAIAGTFAKIGGAIAGAFSLPALGIGALVGVVVGALVQLWQTSEKFRTTVIGAWESAKELFMGFVDVIVEALKIAWDFIQTAIIPIITFLWDIVVQAVGFITEAIIVFWHNILEPFLKGVLDCFSKLIEGVKEVWAFWKPHIENLGKVIKEIWDTMLSPFFSWIKDTFFAYLKDCGKHLQPVINGFKQTFGGIIDFVTGIFAGNWSKAWQGIVNTFGGIFNTLSSLVKAPLNAVISLINMGLNARNEVVSFQIPSWVPKYGGQSVGFRIPHIPYLAKGGVVSSPTLAMIGENGREAVVPLENNTSWLNEIANKLSDRMGGSDRPLNITLKVGETDFGRVAINSINTLQRQSGELLLEI